jgi:cytochrome c-type biogenesis protein
LVDSPSIFLAFAAGFVSFVSPCCLPLVPGYLAAISGGDAAAVERRADARLLARSVVFVGTFAAVFICLGLTATALGAFLAESQLTLRRVSGIVIVGMGVLFVASVFVTRFNRDVRSRTLMARASSGGPVLAGLAFAIAWTPCVGPTLGAILGLAASHSSTGQAAGLLLVYSAGLAVPFLLSAVGFGAARRSFAWLQRNHAVVQAVSGTVLVAMGVLVLTDQLYRLNIAVLHALDSLGLNFFQSV